MCVTVQIGELGTFTDVQIGECGKQRANGPSEHRHAIPTSKFNHLNGASTMLNNVFNVSPLDLTVKITVLTCGM